MPHVPCIKRPFCNQASKKCNRLGKSARVSNPDERRFLPNLSVQFRGLAARVRLPNSCNGAEGRRYNISRRDRRVVAINRGGADGVDEVRERENRILYHGTYKRVSLGAVRVITRVATPKSQRPI